MREVENNYIVLNYHRIGDTDKDNPFHKLHTVTFNTFRRQIKLLKMMAKAISVSDYLAGHNNQKKKWCFSVSFDDVSSSIMKARDYLLNEKIPFCIAPSIESTTNGLGLRDKVYFIQKYVNNAEIEMLAGRTFGANIICGDMKPFSFYSFSKRNDLDQVLMEEKIINPLFEGIAPSKLEKYYERQYLSWQDIKNNFMNNPEITIVNHGYKHYNYEACDKDTIERDIKLSHNAFVEKINITPRYYAVPFGARGIKSMQILEPLLKTYKYNAVFYVKSRIDNKYCCTNHEGQKIINRVHVPSSYYDYLKVLSKILM